MHPRRLYAFHKQTQRGKEKRILFGAGEREVGSQSAFLDICAISAIYTFFENLAPGFILFIHIFFFTLTKIYTKSFKSFVHVDLDLFAI